MERARKSVTVVDRFMEKVVTVPEAGCWLWDAATTKAGYGRFQLGSQNREAHRVSWELFVGDIGDKHVLHKCDVRSCVNPAHLFLGTHLENIQDMDAKGRRATGEQLATKLTKALVDEIRKSNLSNRKLAKHYGVDHRTIGRIKNNQLWRN